jgi:hypothetical protein
MLRCAEPRPPAHLSIAALSTWMGQSLRRAKCREKLAASDQHQPQTTLLGAGQRHTSGCLLPPNSPDWIAHHAPGWA